MRIFNKTRTTSTYDEQELLHSQHEVLELEPTTSTIRRPSFSSDASSTVHDEPTPQRTRNKKRRYRQKQCEQQSMGGYERLGGHITDAWHTVTGRSRSPMDGHLTEDEVAPYQQGPEHEMTNQLKHALYLLLEEPSSSTAAFRTNVVVSFLIVSSALMTTIETIPAFRSAESNRVWFHLELTMVALFTLEYILRLFAHSDSLLLLKSFVIAPISIIDFISIVPFYIEVIAKRDTTYEFRFTILRLFRLLRLFKTYKYSNSIVMTIEVMMVALQRSGDALSALFFFLVTLLVLFSTLIYFAERGSWDDTLKTFVDSAGNPSAFDSIPVAFWFVLVTITTTGYGDMVPTTFIGKLVTFPAMMFGVLLIALPSIIVGRNFTIVWEAMRRRQHLEQIQETVDTASPTQPPQIQSSSAVMEDSFRQRSNSTHTIHSNNDYPSSFNLFDDGNEALFNQLQSLSNITRQNQNDLQRILHLMELRSNATEGPAENGNRMTASASTTSLDIISEE